MDENISLPVPTLENLILSQVAAILWNHNEDSISLANKNAFLMTRMNIPYIIVEEKVIKKISTLQLTNPLVKKLIGRIRPIGLEIIKWQKFQSKISLDEQFLKLSIKSICWTVHGTIDVNKTAKAIIDSKETDPFMKYKLSCHFCLEDDAAKLWKMLTEEDKELFLKPKTVVSFFPLFPLNEEHYFNLETVMTYLISNNIDELQRIYLDIFNVGCVFEKCVFTAIENGNTSATIFYLGKLTPKVRCQRLESFLACLVKRVNIEFLAEFYSSYKGYYQEIFLILSSIYITCKERQNISLRFHLKFLVFFLQWPLQKLFFKVLQDLPFHFQEAESFYFIVHKLLAIKHVGFNDYNYISLLKEFWQKFPHFHSIKLRVTYMYLNISLNREFEYAAFLILTSSCNNRKEFILSYLGRVVCDVLLQNKKFDSLKFFIEVCLEYKDLEELREVFKEVPNSEKIAYLLEHFDSAPPPDAIHYLVNRRLKYSALYSFVDDLMKNNSINKCSAIYKKKHSFCWMAT